MGFRMDKHPPFALAFVSNRSESFDYMGKRFVICNYKIGII